MSTADSAVNTALSNPETDADHDAPPISKMSVGALMAGVLSLLTPLSLALLPLSLLAIAFGAAMLWRHAREGASLGRLFAQIGLGLGVATSVWTITANAAQSHYLHTTAGANAKIYLDNISHGRMYEALELRLPIRQRQIAGTDLAEYYEQLVGEKADVVFDVINAAATKAVRAAGASADWQLVRGVSIQSHRSQKIVVVELRDATNPADFIHVEFRRETYKDEAGLHSQWVVREVFLADKNGKRI